jgi:hypothetical protein
MKRIKWVEIVGEKKKEERKDRKKRKRKMNIFLFESTLIYIKVIYM